MMIGPYIRGGYQALTYAMFDYKRTVTVYIVLKVKKLDG